MPARRAKIAAPHIEDLVLNDLRDADPEGIRARGNYERDRYRDADLAGRDLSGVAFSECEFLGLEAHETTLVGARFIETRLDRVNAPVLRAGRTIWRNVQISGSRLGVVEMYDADVESVRFSGSKLSFVHLSASRVRDAQFDGCVIDELDLSNARVERMAFNECSVRALRLDHAQLKNLDLRGLDLRSISGVDSMSGAIISFSQAVDLTNVFAEHLGITVAE